MHKRLSWQLFSYCLWSLGQDDGVENQWRWANRNLGLRGS